MECYATSDCSRLCPAQSPGKRHQMPLMSLRNKRGTCRTMPRRKLLSTGTLRLHGSEAFHSASVEHDESRSLEIAAHFAVHRCEEAVLIVATRRADWSRQKEVSAINEHFVRDLSRSIGNDADEWPVSNQDSQNFASGRSFLEKLRSCGQLWPSHRSGGQFLTQISPLAEAFWPSFVHQLPRSMLKCWEGKGGFCWPEICPYLAPAGK